MAHLVKNLPATQETLVQSLGWEDLLEKEKATYSSILAWRIPWGSHNESDTTEQLSLSDILPYYPSQVIHLTPWSKCVCNSLH